MNINKLNILDALTELKAIDVALYRYGETLAQSHEKNNESNNFLKFFSKNEIGIKLSNAYKCIRGGLLQSGELTESDLDIMDEACRLKLAKEYNIEY